MSQFNILIVDDDEVDIMNIKRVFAKVNVLNPIFAASDGLEALELLNSGNVSQPLLILLDINMPRMNGIEFLSMIRSMPKWQNVPVVMLTTSDTEKDRIDAYNFSVSGYVVKPMNFSGFVEAISAIRNYWSLCEFPP